jgi:hypothetical protein
LEKELKSTSTKIEAMLLTTIQYSREPMLITTAAPSFIYRVKMVMGNFDPVLEVYQVAASPDRSHRRRHTPQYQKGRIHRAKMDIDDQHAILSRGSRRPSDGKVLPFGGKS